MNLHYILRKYLFFSLKSNMRCSIIHGFSHNLLVNKNLMNNKIPDLTRSEYNSANKVLFFKLLFSSFSIKS